MIEPNLARGGKPERAMGCGQDEAAVGEMRPHELGQALLRDGIQRAQRLIEQPDRARDDEEAGDREAAALPRREIGGGEVGERFEPDPRQRLADSGGSGAEKVGPELQILAYR